MVCVRKEAAGEEKASVRTAMPMVLTPRVGGAGAASHDSRMCHMLTSHIDVCRVDGRERQWQRVRERGGGVHELLDSHCVEALRHA